MDYLSEFLCSKVDFTKKKKNNEIGVTKLKYFLKNSFDEKKENLHKMKVLSDKYLKF